MNLKNKLLNKFKSDYKFTFSIIMAVYNTEEYLKETIDSIINQDFDFTRVQIILVDDGSEDNSKDICLDYAQRYQNNVVYVHQENQGQASARNNGLKYVEGEFINFLDSDDKLEPNTLSEIYQHFKKWKSELDVITIPRYMFGRMQGAMRFGEKYENSRIVDIHDEYDFPQVSVSAAFIKSSAVRNEFDTRVIISEDSLFINGIILEKCKFGVVGSCRYLYRKRPGEDSTIDTRKIRKDYFSTRMELYFKQLIRQSIDKHGKVLEYIQNVLVYDLYWLFTQNTEADVLDASEKQQYYQDIHEVLQHIDDDTINAQNFRKSLKYHMLAVKYGKCGYEIRGDNVMLNGKDFDRLSNYMIFISEIGANMDIYFEFYPVEFSLTAHIDGKVHNLTPYDVNETISLGQPILNRHHYSITLDGSPREIYFIRHMNSHDYEVKLKNVSDKQININDNRIILR